MSIIKLYFETLLNAQCALKLSGALLVVFSLLLVSGCGALSVRPQDLSARFTQHDDLRITAGVGFDFGEWNKPKASLQMPLLTSDYAIRLRAPLSISTE